MNSLCGDKCSYVCPQTWLYEARTNIALSPTMGFFNENDSLAYFAILGELSSGLSFTAGFFNTLSFLSLLVGFFRGQGRTYLATPLCFNWLKKIKYQKRIFFAFCTKFEDIPSRAYFITVTLEKPWTRVHVKYILPNGAFVSTFATFVQKWA